MARVTFSTRALVSSINRVSTALAYTHAGPFSLKQNGVLAFHTASGCTDQHTAHSPHAHCENAVEHGLRTRAIIVNMRGRLKIRQWEKTPSAAMVHTSAHLVSPNAKQVDNKLLAIDLSSLKQLIWDTTVMIVTRRSMDRRAVILVGLTRLRPAGQSLAIKTKKQEVESTKQRAGTVARS